MHDLELLGGADVPDVPTGTLSGCFPLAPYAGRVRDGALEFEGLAHALPRTAGRHALHGLVYDVAWSAGLDVRVDDRWPFAATVRQELALRADGLTARLVLTAQERQPAWTGWHPWLRRRLSRGAPARLDWTAQAQYVSEDGLPTGELEAPREGPHDDCFSGVAQPLVVTWPDALRLELRASTSTWVVFDEHPDAFCLEPQTAPPDAAHLGLATVLEPDEELVCELALRWSLL